MLVRVNWIDIDRGRAKLCLDAVTFISLEECHSRARSQREKMSAHNQGRKSKE